MNRHKRIVVIVGPTAGGKSELAVAIARALGGEIINADSMQVYRELNVGTAKPTPEQRAAAMHHLIDCVDPTESWTVADWLDAAEHAIADIHDRDRLPIVVGGTNLYLKALLEGMFDGPPADEAFRASLADIPSHDLHARLAEADPESAERIHRNDHKRIVRALEVMHVTGKPMSEHQTQWQGQAYRHNPILIGLNWPTEAINRRINARVKAMFHPPQEGESLVDETRRLETAGRLGPQAREALGTKQVLDHLAGRLTLDECFERVKIDTRRFAKQQRTWLKRYLGVKWLDPSAADWPSIESEAIEHVRAATSPAG
jgi:tRNA dimethylallyltransferase